MSRLEDLKDVFKDVDKGRTVDDYELVTKEEYESVLVEEIPADGGVNE